MDSKKALYIKHKPEDISFSSLPDFGLKKPLRDFQVKGLLYLYYAKKCILADSTGLGKTVQCVALFQLLEKLKEKEFGNRWIIVVPPTVMYQWQEEFRKFTTLPEPVICNVPFRERLNYYIGDWSQFYVMSYQTLWRDWEYLKQMNIKNWVFDDAHFFRHHSTKTARIVKHLTKDANRVILCSATPIQKNLLDLHSLLEALGLNHIFGSKHAFENRYCVVKLERKVLRDGRSFTKKTVVGIKNVEELKQKLDPFYLKRTFNDVKKELPSLIVKPILLDLYPQQQKLYKQTKNSVLRAWDAGNVKTLINKGFHSLVQICSGTQTAGLDTDCSSKLDLIEDFIQYKLDSDDKMIIYSYYKRTIQTLLRRLRKYSLEDSCVTITGDDRNKFEREEVRKRFQDDPSCRILIGTDAIEVGLNLQSARYLLMVNLILNPQRMVQLIGRLRRIGSKYKTIVVYVLIAKHTIEERLWRKINFEALINDIVFNEKSDVFTSFKHSDIIGMLRED